jgi:hypothetical protein
MVRRSTGPRSTEPGVTPIGIDITYLARVARPAHECAGVTLLE